ncbi:efflux RND transporter periplasmic adaptor subunit [soil metagenome]
MKLRYIVFGLIGFGLLALIAYRLMANTEGSSDSRGRAPAAVKVTGMVIQPEHFAENLTLSGTLEANEEIDLRSEVSGIIENISFTEGSRVTKGQILFRVNDQELRAQLAKVQTAQNLAAENERRAKLLLEKEAISQEEYDMAEANYASARAESQLMQAQLGKATVRAPFAGVIGLRYISQGTYVTPSTPIARLVNTDQLKITFAIPEKYSSQIGINDNIVFTTSNSSTRYNAKIYAIEPGVDLATRTLRMRAITENKQGHLIPGSFANVFLPLAAVNDALMVPSEALIPIQNGRKLFIAENGRAKEVIVETGARTESKVRVLSGIKAGDTILTTGIMVLRDGSLLNIDLRQPVANSQS